MKPKFKSNIDKQELFRLRIDCLDSLTPSYFGELLSEWFLKETIKNYLVVAEISSVTAKKHLHVVFTSVKKITALRTSFRKCFCHDSTEYSFSQNWSGETKSRNMRIYMERNELDYKDIHIIYILKDKNILLNTLVQNTDDLDFTKITNEIGEQSKKQKKYGNFTKKLIMDYNSLFPVPIFENLPCTGISDFPERERIFKFVTSSFSQNNLDIFQSNAKLFDNWTIKKMCQTVLNTRKYSKEFYPDDLSLIHI